MRGPPPSAWRCKPEAVRTPTGSTRLVRFGFATIWRSILFNSIAPMSPQHRRRHRALKSESKNQSDLSAASVVGRDAAGSWVASEMARFLAKCSERGPNVNEPHFAATPWLDCRRLCGWQQCGWLDWSPVRWRHSWPGVSEHGPWSTRMGAAGSEPFRNLVKLKQNHVSVPPLWWPIGSSA